MKNLAKKFNQLKREILNSDLMDTYPNNPNLVFDNLPKNFKLGDSLDIMFIGEAPGAKEDELGKPFVGRSGKILRQMLKDTKLDQSTIYISNTIKLRPPKNRDPKKSEKQAWYWVLKREIQLLKPQIIAPLGRHSMLHFLPKDTISNSHGKRFLSTTDLSQNQIIFPLYHPAVALYSRSKLSILETDMQALKKELQTIKSK